MDEDFENEDFDDDYEEEETGGYVGDYSEFVARGVNFLDKYFGKVDWRAAIDKENLALSDEESCVLGQLFGNYFVGLERIGVSHSFYSDQGGSASFGFVTANDDYRSEAYPTLTQAWLKVL